MKQAAKQNNHRHIFTIIFLLANLFGGLNTEAQILEVKADPNFPKK